jgi:hypothetical protein
MLPGMFAEVQSRSMGRAIDRYELCGETLCLIVYYGFEEAERYRFNFHHPWRISDPTEVLVGSRQFTHHGSGMRREVELRLHWRRRWSEAAVEWNSLTNPALHWFAVMHNDGQKRTAFSPRWKSALTPLPAVAPAGRGASPSR